ncbi:MAG: DinB family protein [bacterium]
MTVSTASAIASAVRSSHKLLLDIVEQLEDDQFRAPPGPSLPSIGFHVWHVARWADLLQSRMTSVTADLPDRLGQGEDIWMRDGLAGAWGFPAGSLGEMESGMGMDEDVSVSLPLPPKEVLLAYARDVFAAVDRALAAADGRFEEACIDLYGRANSVAGMVLSHVRHGNRHLGMIEALRGVYGQRGTAAV